MTKDKCLRAGKDFQVPSNEEFDRERKRTLAEMRAQQRKRQKKQQSDGESGTT